MYRTIFTKFFFIGPFAALLGTYGVLYLTAIRKTRNTPYWNSFWNWIEIGWLGLAFISIFGAIPQAVSYTLNIIIGYQNESIEREVQAVRDIANTYLKKYCADKSWAKDMHKLDRICSYIERLLVEHENDAQLVNDIEIISDEETFKILDTMSELEPDSSYYQVVYKLHTSIATTIGMVRALKDLKDTATSIHENPYRIVTYIMALWPIVLGAAFGLRFSRAHAMFHFKMMNNDDSENPCAQGQGRRREVGLKAQSRNGETKS